MRQDPRTEDLEQEELEARSKSTKSEKAAVRTKPLVKQPSFPWLPLLLLIAGIVIFWVLPSQLGPRPVQVEFSKESSE